MVLISLQSGSAGNCIYVESGGASLLFDAGLSPKQVEERLAKHGISPRTLQGIVISHNHSDHIRFAASCSKKFDIPLLLTEPTLEASRPVIPRHSRHTHLFRSGDSLKFGNLTVETVGTPHDAADGVVFVVSDGRQLLGICTDVGHVYGDLRSLVRDVDGLFLESNYDDEMLRTGHYPYFLKKRISGPGGHISNREAAALVAEHACLSRLQWLCLAHLSEKNNTPEKAMQAHREVLGASLPIHMTSRYQTTDRLSLKPRQLSFDF